MALVAVKESATNLSRSDISKAEFRLFQQLIHDEIGVFLPMTKQALLVGRLSRRLRDLDLATYSAYYDYIQEYPAELTELLDRVSTNETKFFRDPRHFQFIENEVIPRWQAEAAAGQRVRQVRAWSAACSTGQEAYSLAMTLHRGLQPANEWSIDILGSDISTRVLKKAQSATWEARHALDIPISYRKEFMLRGVRAQEGMLRASSTLRDMVNFRRINLNTPRIDVHGKFDLIFCCNILIYFDAPSKKRVIEKLLGHLNNDGYLFFGTAESAATITNVIKNVAPTIYIKKQAA